MLAKKIALGVGIAIVLPMLIHYGVATFYPEPRPEDYRLSAETNALAHGSASGQVKFEQEQGRKGDELAAAEAQFERRLFAVAVPLGLVAIVVGAFLSVQATGTGLMFGGRLCLRWLLQLLGAFECQLQVCLPFGSIHCPYLRWFTKSLREKKSN